MFEELVNQVNKAQRILLFPHVNMDGDSAGSTKALCLALRKMGKECFVLADEPVAEYVDFLDFDGFVMQAPYVPELAIAVDCGEPSRIEARLDVFMSAKTRLCVDHHIPQGPFADYSVVNPDAAAAGVLVWYFIKELGVVPDKDMADAIFTAVLTDTGCFKFANTNAEAHMIAADLMNYNIDNVKICSYVYDNSPYKQLKLEAIAQERAVFVKDGLGVISYLDYETWNGMGAPYNYTDTSIDALRKIKGVEIAACLKEKEPGLFKVSFRSKNYANVAQICFRHDGGGHERAAACTLKMPFEEAFKLIVSEVENTL